MLEIYFKRNTTTFSGQQIRFTPTEFAIFSLLVQYRGKTLTNQMISNHIYGEMRRSKKTLAQHLFKLRRKIRAVRLPLAVFTVHGFGCRLEVG